MGSGAYVKHDDVDGHEGEFKVHRIRGELRSGGGGEEWKRGYNHRPKVTKGEDFLDLNCGSSKLDILSPVPLS
jgi:hypothetical protein